MRIAANGWFLGQLSTGSGQYLQALLEHLPSAAAGHDLRLILPAIGSQAAEVAGWQVEVAGAGPTRLGGNLAKVWFEQVAFPRACRRLGADLAFVPYWGSPWWSPCPVVVTIHDLIPWLLPAYRGGPLQRLYTALVVATARRTALVLTDSRASRQDIVDRLGLPGVRVHAVPLAVGERYRPVTDPGELGRVREKYGLGTPAARVAGADRAEVAQSGQFILYLGGFDARKNVPGLIRAYARLAAQTGDEPLPPLVIAGRLPAVDSAFTPDPRRVAAEAGIAQRVQFLGWVDEADKPALYSLAAAFVFPSLYEGFGLPVAEAAACGTPVVTSNRSSLPEAAPGAVLVDPEDVQSIADGLAVALAGPGLQGLPPARTWGDVAGESVALMEKVAGLQRHSGPPV